jgi:hypothetical protein
MALSTLPGLSEWCAENDYRLEGNGPEEATLTDEESGNVWSLFRTESWLQVMAGVVENIGASHAVCLTLARLHGRLLGCRYSIDESGSLLLHADLYPHDQTGSAVGAVVTQMQWVVDSTYELLMRVQESGRPAEDEDIDEAFGLACNAGVN